MNGQLQELARMYARFDSELNSLEAERKQSNDSYHEKNLELKKLTHEVERFDHEKGQAEQAVRHMMKENPWISEQLQYASKSIYL
jgi:predicted  nucleic acid-binding Zn-ribbon protein